MSPGAERSGTPPEKVNPPELRLEMLFEIQVPFDSWAPAPVSWM